LSDIGALENRTLRVIRSVRDSGGWLGFAPPDDFSTRERENGPTLGTGRRHPGIADLDGDGFADFGYVGTFDERSYEPIILRSKPAATRAMADALETQVADLQQQLGTLPQQLAALTAERDGLLGTVAQLRQELAAATATIGSFRSTLAAVQQEMSAVLKEPGFVIPGGTPELQLQNLFRGIAALNHGQRQALGKALKGN
jgi:hypothetical protein